MTISKMKLKYSSLFFVPFVVMLGVFLSLGLTPFRKIRFIVETFFLNIFRFISDCINYFGVEILVVYFGPSRNHLEEPCQVSGALIV